MTTKVSAESGVSVDARQAAIDSYRRRGRKKAFAIVGLTAAAAPIRSAHGDVIASMSVSGSTYRMSGDALDEVIAHLREAAAEVSRRLGWVGLH